jgi:predicted nucleotidyltransferase
MKKTGETMKRLKDLDLQDNEIRALEELKDRLCEKFPYVKIILYGSKARGDFREFSDLDILILVNSKINRKLKEKITEIKYNIELKNDVVFGTIIENKEFWESPLALVMPLHRNIDREGVNI